MLAPIIQAAIDDPATDPAVRELFGTVAAPTHKFDSSLIGVGLAAILYPFLQAALQPHVNSLAQQAWSRDENLVLTPAELALAVIKNTMTHADAVAEVGDSGINPARFDVMVNNTGEPPGIAELLQALRRGIIDQTRLAHGVRQSRVRDEWLDVITALRYAPPPAGEVVAGRVKEHLTDAEYHQKLSEAGTDPANAAWMLAAAGRPYGIEQALHLLNRGVIDEARVRQVIAQSDVNTEFTDDILELRHYFPPPRSIVPMLRSGAITEAQARTLLADYGVGEPWATAFITEATHTKAAEVKQLSQAQTLRMYGAKFIDHATATDRLQRLGYDAATITLLLEFADEAQHERYTNAVVTRIHSRFVNYKLTEAEARSALTADHIPAGAITDLLALWNIERDANVHVLTPAAIVGAYRRQEIGPAETKRRLLAVGVQQADLAIVVADGFAPTKPNPTAVAAVVNA
ncbi:MAG TPA: hypothetical protein VFO15_18030 [Xanthobacteraceae bacterium]|nr:hypothetical protein [Xanthobacteraceae bacterium]